MSSSIGRAPCRGGILIDQEVDESAADIVRICRNQIVADQVHLAL